MTMTPERIAELRIAYRHGLSVPCYDVNECLDTIEAQAKEIEQLKEGIREAGEIMAEAIIANSAQAKELERLRQGIGTIRNMSLARKSVIRMPDGRMLDNFCNELLP